MDLAELQGTWNVTALEVDGARMGEAVFGGAHIVVRGNSFTSLGMGAEYSGSLHLDAARTPHHLDMKFETGPEKGNTAYAICELENDTWRLCLTLAGTNRPTEFVSRPGSGHAFEILTRAPGGVRLAQPATSIEEFERAAPAPELEGEWSMLSCVRDGLPLEDSMVKSARRVAKNGETSVSFGGGVFLQARVKADPVNHTIDYLLTAGPAKGQIQRGIYEREGGTFRLCFGAPGADRPADYTTRPGDGKTVTLWKPQS